MQVSSIKLLRDIALVKAQVKDEPLRSQLLGPLQAQLEALAKAQAAQMSLPIDSSTAPPKSAVTRARE